MNTTLHLPLVDGAFFIDNSFLEEAMSCSRLSSYVIFRRLRSSSPNWALTYGGIIHKALEVRYASGDPLVSKDLELAMLNAVDEGFSRATPPENDFRTHQQAVDQIRAYNQAYPIESFTPLSTDAHTEIPFAIPFAELEFNREIPIWDLPTNVKEVRYISTLPVFFSGRIDLAFRTQSGEARFMDHKTSSMGGASMFDPHYTGTQMKGYCWALSQLMKEKVRTYCINALIGRRPTRTGTQFEFARDVHTFSDEHIAEWEQTARAILHRLFHNWSSNSFPMEPRWCVNKFGKCEFFDVCMLPPSQRDVMLTSGAFTHNTWNPIEDPARKPQPHEGVLFI